MWYQTDGGRTPGGVRCRCGLTLVWELLESSIEGRLSEQTNSHARRLEGR